MAGKKKIFISYSWKDQAEALRIRASIPAEFDVWIDVEQMNVGGQISRMIEAGLNGSDYYLLLISESSNSSPWVQRELAAAFQLANEKKLSVVPFWGCPALC